MCMLIPLGRGCIVFDRAVTQNGGIGHNGFNFCHGPTSSNWIAAVPGLHTVGAAGLCRSFVCRQPSRFADAFETLFIALQAGPVACAGGVSLQVSEALSEADVDALLIAGFWAESSRQVEKVVSDNHALVLALAACSK